MGVWFPNITKPKCSKYSAVPEACQSAGRPRNPSLASRAAPLPRRTVPAATVASSQCKPVRQATSGATLCDTLAPVPSPCGMYNSHPSRVAMACIMPCNMTKADIIPWMRWAHCILGQWDHCTPHKSLAHPPLIPFCNLGSPLLLLQWSALLEAMLHEWWWSEEFAVEEQTLELCGRGQLRSTGGQGTWLQARCVFFFQNMQSPIASEWLHNTHCPHNTRIGVDRCVFSGLIV